MNMMNSAVIEMDEKQRENYERDTTELLKFGEGSMTYSEENSKLYVERFADSTGVHK